MTLRTLISRTKLLRKISSVIVLLTALFFLFVYIFIPYTFNYWYDAFYYQWIGSKYSVEKWRLPTEFCGGSFVGYGNQFAVLHNAKVVPYKPGIFCIPCSDSFPSYTFYEHKLPNHLNHWVKELCYSDEKHDVDIKIIEETTIAVRRYEYANLYHQMTDWYNVFAQAKLMGYDLNNLNILIVDWNLKSGILDETWNVLFNNVTYLQDMTRPVVYSKLVWAIIGYNSPLWHLNVQKPLPFIEDFRIFFSQQYKIMTDKQLTCSKLNITFLWRRNYISHKGNPSGLIKRKIANEDMLIEAVKFVMGEHIVRGVQLDQLSMTEQLQMITSTDILVAMHGAGLTHVLFLPPHAGVVEFFPNYMIFQFPCFRAMAKWRQLHYTSWTNNDPKQEFKNFSTVLSPSVVQQKIKMLYSKICP